MPEVLDTIIDGIQAMLGLEGDLEDINALQMALRAIVIYAFTLAIVRLGSKRFMGKVTSLDIIIAIILGSVMSRAINGSAPFLPTMVAGAVLIAMHWVLAALAAHSNWFSPLVKGNPVLLIKDGEIRSEGMRKADLSQGDLMEALRLQARQTDIGKIKLAYLERNGKISFIPYDEN